MKKIEIPEFKTYEEEASFWDNLDTADYMEDDGEWFQFEIDPRVNFRVPLLPDTAKKLKKIAHKQGVSVETLVNVLLVEQIHQQEDNLKQLSTELVIA